MNPKRIWPKFPITVLSIALSMSQNALAAEPQVAAPAQTENSATSANTSSAPSDAEKAICMETLELTVRPEHRQRLKNFCEKPAKIENCQSTQGRAIQHVDFESTDPRGKRILVFGLMHGDEPLAGEMALEWAHRLSGLDKFRNAWRVVPLMNPDGLRTKTRLNARGVDLNRNFPTKDWETAAQEYWKVHAKADPRRYPGDGPASEAETKCAVEHIKDFRPDFIVSVHTPYKVLDFDGPQMAFPKYKDLPWRALGNFPGSLGRYMWRDSQVPVLTVELGQSMVDAATLQDIVGGFAIEASKRANQKTVSQHD